MTDSASTNLAVVHAFNAAMAQFDYDAALALIADDCQYQNMPDPGKVMVGPTGVRAALQPFFGLTIANELVTLRAAESGHLVFLERLDRHQLPDGRWVELPVTGVYEVVNGKIKLYRDYFNAQTLYAQWPELLGGRQAG